VASDHRYRTITGWCMKPPRRRAELSGLRPPIPLHHWVVYEATQAPSGAQWPPTTDSAPSLGGLRPPIPLHQFPADQPTEEIYVFTVVIWLPGSQQLKGDMRHCSVTMAPARLITCAHKNVTQAACALN
jgi:hypothetical protein